MERIYSSYTKKSKEVIFLRDNLIGRFHILFFWFETAIHDLFSRHRWLIYGFLVGVLSSHHAFN